jgi:RNA methyltransferase, TrmH family
VSLISTIRDLHRRRGRERRGLTLAEGVRLVEEAVAAGVLVRGAAVGPALEGTPRGVALKARLRAANVTIEEVSDADLVRLADTEHPQGIVAVIEPPRWTLDRLTLPPDGVVVVLDGVQDPGNVGALGRTALGLGAAGLIALPGTADLHNPKVLRGSMGALFRLPALHLQIAELLAWARGTGVELWTSAAGGVPVGGARRDRPMALVVGNEGAGVCPDLSAVAARTVAVPLRGGVESLNVAVAAGILLYEVTRDR